MQAVVILAAGTASRMGQNKMLLPWHDSTILEQTLNTAEKANFNYNLVVLGNEAEKIKAEIKFENWQIIFNPNYRKGQSSSLLAALEFLPENITGAVFGLGDQPMITLDTWQKIKSLGKDNNIVIPYYINKENILESKTLRGNPVFIGKKFLPILQKSKGDEGARWLFKKYPESVIKLELTDPGIYLDIDTPEQYKKYSKSFN